MEAARPVRWRDFFESHAPYYDQNPFTRNTRVEVQFLVERLGLKPDMRVLDMGCGTGRHAIELASKGMRVTGVDISPAMLREARKKAEAAGLEVEWIEADALSWSRERAFDAAICLCEGGFGLLNDGDDAVAHDMGILSNIRASLTPGAPFVLTALNGYSVIRRVTDEHIENGAFDPATMEMHYADEWQLPEGPRTMLIRERLFIPPEVVAMLHHAGFDVLAVHGGTAGEWGERPLKLDEVEAMYVCRAR